jgi:putative hydrolase of the HAD superfamily
MPIRQACFDLDDTMVPNTHKYHQPILRCASIIVEALGTKSPYPPDLLKIHYDIDSKMVEEFGFGQERFPTSWVRTYEMLAEKAGCRVDAGIKKRLYNTAKRFRHGPFRPFDGALSALAEIRSRGIKTHLVTAGDEELQWKKIRTSGIEEHFDSIHVTPMKKKDILSGIVGDRPEEGIMVGDSKKSDIIPAVELGMVAAWIPSQTWTFADAPIEASKYHELKSVTEVPGLIKRLS